MTMLAICTSHKIVSFSHLLRENLAFITNADTTSSFDNFNMSFFSFEVYFFECILIYCFAHMTSANTPCLCHLITENGTFRWRTGLIIFNFFFSRFKQFYLYTKINIHNILAKKLYNLVICSCEIES